LNTAYIDLFSGIGGFALAAYWSGLRFDKHYFSEVDDYAVRLYQKRFPEAIPLGDIRNVDYSKLPKGDYLVTGGFPCQPHSIAGKRKGCEDERDLWRECFRMLCELRPKFAVFENVPELLISNNGQFFNRVLSDIHRGGMMRNGKLYRLAKSAHLIKEKGCGLLPTPRASDCKRIRFKKNTLEKVVNKNLNNGNHFSLSLPELIKYVTGKPMNISLPEIMMGYPKNWTQLKEQVTPLFLNVQS